MQWFDELKARDGAGQLKQSEKMRARVFASRATELMGSRETGKHRFSTMIWEDR